MILYHFFQTYWMVFHFPIHLLIIKKKNFIPWAIAATHDIFWEFEAFNDMKGNIHFHLLIYCITCYMFLIVDSNIFQTKNLKAPFWGAAEQAAKTISTLNKAMANMLALYILQKQHLAFGVQHSLFFYLDLFSTISVECGLLAAKCFAT